MTTRVDFHQSALHELLNSAEVVQGIERVADKVAQEMSRAAPRGQGEHFADHITTASGVDGTGPYVEIGVDSKRFFYWRFQEFGTQHMSGHSFARPALKKHYTA
jgi:HK97 gp10 family phage protein